jgi:hypothetical protein
MLGTTKSMRGPPSEYSNGRLKKNSNNSGMTSVSITCSPLRTNRRSSIPVWARNIRPTAAAPGAGAKGDVVLVAFMSAHRA